MSVSQTCVLSWRKPRSLVLGFKVKCRKIAVTMRSAVSVKAMSIFCWLPMWRRVVLMCQTLAM
ncbi:Uncharacterised protein [Vibrio cholerae]|nr:Uncharacterised protein [Vibrio cholerae]